MPIALISNGEGGLSVRGKLNDVITEANKVEDIETALAALQLDVGTIGDGATLARAPFEYEDETAIITFVTAGATPYVIGGVDAEKEGRIHVPDNRIWYPAKAYFIDNLPSWIYPTQLLTNRTLGSDILCTLQAESRDPVTGLWPTPPVTAGSNEIPIYPLSLAPVMRVSIFGKSSAGGGSIRLTKDFKVRVTRAVDLNGRSTRMLPIGDSITQEGGWPHAMKRLGALYNFTVNTIGTAAIGDSSNPSGPFSEEIPGEGRIGRRLESYTGDGQGDDGLGNLEKADGTIYSFKVDPFPNEGWTDPTPTPTNDSQPDAIDYLGYTTPQKTAYNPFLRLVTVDDLVNRQDRTFPISVDGTAVPPVNGADLPGTVASYTWQRGRFIFDPAWYFSRWNGLVLYFQTVADANVFLGANPSHASAKRGIEILADGSNRGYYIKQAAEATLTGQTTITGQKKSAIPFTSGFFTGAFPAGGGTSAGTLTAPEFVIINLGTNDANNLVPLSIWIRSISAIIRQLREAWPTTNIGWFANGTFRNRGADQHWVNLMRIYPDLYKYFAIRESDVRLSLLPVHAHMSPDMLSASSVTTRDTDPDTLSATVSALDPYHYRETLRDQAARVAFQWVAGRNTEGANPDAPTFPAPAVRFTLPFIG